MLKKELPSPLTILALVIVIAAVCTVFIPAGKYSSLFYEKGTSSFQFTDTSGAKALSFTQATLDSLSIKISLEKFAGGEIRKPVSVPGSYMKLSPNRQGIAAISQAPVKGFVEAADIIFFIMTIGGFMQVFNGSGALTKGLAALSRKMKGKEAWLIILLTFLFSFAGASYGMAEEALVFYAVLVPLFLAAGYDALVPVAVIFGGTQLGTLSSFSNPFSTIIASNAAGVNWSDGFYERIIMFLLTTTITVWYIVRYAKKVKRNPAASLLFREGSQTPARQGEVYPGTEDYVALTIKTKLLLLLFPATFLTMIAGVIWFDWWLTEMTALFMVSSILTAIILRMREKTFISEFVRGCEGLLGVAMIVGVARGVTVILNDGNISDSIVFYAARMVSGMPPSFFIVMTMLLFILFTLFISSSSGMAVLTMPIMGSLAMLVNVPGREIVNAYLFGMGIMGFITPTGLILPSLAIANVSIRAWWKFIWPLLLMLSAVCILCLLIGIRR